MSKPQRPTPRAGVLAIKAYVPGKSTAPNVERVFKLSSNETPLGPSPKAIAAYHAVAAYLQDYPDGAATALREAIGSAFGLDPNRIVCGAGSDDLINLLAHAYIAPGDEAVHTTHGFLMYPIAILGAGGTPVVAREVDHTADVDAILAAVTDRTRIVFLANPNNPTGTYIPFDEVKRLHRALPPHVLLVLDAAYAEYVRRNDYESGIEAIADTGHVEAARGHNDRWLAWVADELGKLGLKVTPSVTNFVLIHFPETKGRTAKDADQFLTARGLVLRRVEGYQLPHALRMTIGSEEANRLVVAALTEFMGQAT